MNIYKVLNDITLYIDDNLTEKIDYEVIASMLTTNVYTMQRLFSIVTGIPLGEYIRKRKLSLAAFDLINTSSSVIDIAIKYGYENATSFSRAFSSFHGIKPSDAKMKKKFKEFPRIIYEEKEMPLTDVPYEVINLPELTLYEVSISTNNKSIKSDAPNFIIKCLRMYEEPIKYAMVSYEDKERCNCNKYSVLYSTKQNNAKEITIPKHKWLKYTCAREAKDIQKTSNDFYTKILPSLKYTLSDLPELEYYHDDITDFLVPIE